MQKKYKIGLVVALVIVLVGGYYYFNHKSSAPLVGSALNCGSGEATCLPNLELTGSYNSTFSSLQVDKGASTFAGTVSFGSSGTAINNIISGTCFIKAYTTTIAGNGSVITDCAATTSNTVAPLAGVQVGDRIVVELSTTTATALAPAVVMNGASASTTNGYITLEFQNATSTVYTWTATGTTSPVQFIDIR